MRTNPRYRLSPTRRVSRPRHEKVPDQHIQQQQPAKRGDLSPRVPDTRECSLSRRRTLHPPLQILPRKRHLRRPLRLHLYVFPHGAHLHQPFMPETFLHHLPHRPTRISNPSPNYPIPRRLARLRRPLLRQPNPSDVRVRPSLSGTEGPSRGLSRSNGVRVL